MSYTVTITTASDYKVLHIVELGIVILYTDWKVINDNILFSVFSDLTHTSIQPDSVLYTPILDKLKDT